MSAKMDTKAARLIALGHAIQEGYFNPETVNMSDLARALGVHRGTIMRDLCAVQSMLDESRRIQAILRNTATTTTRRHND